MIEQTAQPGAPAAPAQSAAPEAARIVRIPPPGASGHEAAEAAYAKLAGAQGGESSSGEVNGAPADGAPAPAGEQFATIADPVQAMHASRELATGLQETGEIAGLDKGTAEFYSRHLNAALQRPPITQAQSDAQQAETRRMLAQTYGAKAEQMIQDARAELAELTKRLPNLPAWLDHTGGGNEAMIVIQLSRQHQERQRARMLSGVRRR